MAATIDAAFPRAYQFLFRAARYKVAYGGRGGGRSWSFARALLLRGVERPTRVLCAREFQNSIEDSVHQLLRDQIARLGLDAHYRITRREIVGPAGTTFLFEGLRHNVSKIKSMEGVDVAWIEEAEKVSAHSWETLIPTIRKAGSEIWVSFNPDQEDDPTYQRFIVAPPDNAIVVKTSWRDNPWFPDTLARERAHLARVDPERYMHVWEGECRSHNEAQVLSGKWQVAAFTPQTTGPGAWDGPYYGADWGFARDPTTLVRFWLSPDNRLLIEHEAYGVGVDLNATPALFNSVPGAADHQIRADSARPETISHMQHAGYHVVGAPKWSGSVADGVAWLRGFDAIVIHDRCRYAAQEARLWSYKTDTLTGQVLPKLAPGQDHIFDAVRYGAAPMIANQGSAAAGLIIKRDWWRAWPGEEPPTCSHVLQFIVPAFDARESVTASARTTWGVFRRAERWDGARYVASDDPRDVHEHCVLLERWCADADYPELRRVVQAGVREYTPDALFVEARDAGRALVHELRAARLTVRPLAPSKDIVADMHLAAIVPSAGRVWRMPRVWADDVVRATAEFPHGGDAALAHAAAAAWRWLRQRGDIALADEAEPPTTRPPPAPAAVYG